LSLTEKAKAQKPRKSRMSCIERLEMQEPEKFEELDQFVSDRIGGVHVLSGMQMAEMVRDEFNMPELPDSIKKAMFLRWPELHRVVSNRA